MGETTAISWCRHTFNPWIGCTKVSPACDGCYAEALMDLRYGRVQWGPHGERIRTAETNWKQPLKWDRAAAKAGERPFVFCASLADVFDNQVQSEWRNDLFDLIKKTPNLVWLLLTKRPQNIIEMSEAAGGLPLNAAIGTTVEDQKRADMNVPHLLVAKTRLKPAFAFLSCEPLLGPIDLCHIPFTSGDQRHKQDALTGEALLYAIGKDGNPDMTVRVSEPRLARIDWVITGGETDQGKHKARPTHPQWFRSLRDQCAAHGVAYHHKQNGEWMPHRPVAGGDLGGDVRSGRVMIVHPTGQTDVEVSESTGGRNTIPGSRYMARVGKKNSGRLLDGVEHNAFPAIPGDAT